MGHFWDGQTDWDGLHCVGFQTIFARSVEYAATGQVSLPIPPEFPGTDEVSFVEPYAVSWTKKTSKLSVQTTGKKKRKNPYAILTPEEELETFELAPDTSPSWSPPNHWCRNRFSRFGTGTEPFTSRR